MFNKTPFNKSPYDLRTNFSVPFGVSLYSQGELGLDLLVKLQLSGNIIGGGSTQCFFYTVTELETQTMAGNSTLTISDLALFVVPMTPPMITGISDMQGEVVMVTPLTVDFSGDGAWVTTEHFNQNIVADIRSTNGTMSSDFNLVTNIDTFELSGNSSLNSLEPVFLKDLTVTLTGDGDVKIPRLTEIGVAVLELIGIDLAPGGYLKIDTDMLTMLVNGLSDVSSITSESVFFELEPGANEIKIEYDGGANASVHTNILWQNRWL